MVIVLPLLTVTPMAGEVMVDVGAVVSMVLVAATSGEASVAGCAPRSAKRFTVACCMRLSGGVDPSGEPPRPHDHWMVPLLKTSAPLAARYMVRWWVALSLEP